MLDNSLAYCGFEVAVALAVELMLNFLHCFARNRGINAHKIVDSVLALGIANLSLAVGYGTLELLHNNLGLIKNGNIAVCVLVRLAHLSCRVLQ